MMLFQTGERAHSLATMLANKLPIPSGFIVASQAFEAFVEENDIRESVESILKGQSFDSPKSLKAASTQIRRQILSGEFPTDIAHQILSMYIKLGEPRVMLFPSIALTKKDLENFTSPENALYGYQGDANLFEGIKELWSHFFDPQPLYYRLKHKKDHFTLPFAITVQSFPVAKVSGVMFTDDVTSHTKQTVLLKIVHGEGALIGELDGADYYWIKRGTGDVYKSSTDTQKTRIIFENGEEEQEKIPSSLSKKRKASQDLLVRLAKLAAKLQQHMFFPQQATFSFDGENVALIDTKPAPTHTGSIVAPSPVFTPSSKTMQPDPTKAGLVTLGLLHPLPLAAHAPKFNHISGHLLLESQYILSEFAGELTLQKQRLLTHELKRTISFITTHCKVDHGCIYTFPKAQSSLHHIEAQLTALQEIRQDFPLLPLLLVAETSEAQPYRFWNAQWNTRGFMRSSQIGHALLLNTPASIHELTQNQENGIDAVVVDVDQLDLFMHGGEEHTNKSSITPALMEQLQRILNWCQENGTVALFSSKRPVDYAMLNALAGEISIEWLTSEPLYGHLITQSA
ncbi:MAG: PEP/pyruvate-binding domain-containing protein [Candidatus Woesebacteria bacterium]